MVGIAAVASANRRLNQAERTYGSASELVGCRTHALFRIAWCEPGGSLAPVPAGASVAAE